MLTAQSDIDARAAAARIVDVLTAHRFNYSGELQLQEGIAAALRGAGMFVRREVRLSARDRIDLLVDRVGIEVKVAGNVGSVQRQLVRYARSDQVAALILVTTRPQHEALPECIDQVSLRVLRIGGVV